MVQPSVDCLGQNAPLGFGVRIIRNTPDVILALLALRPKGKRLPWTELILEDFRSLQLRVLQYSNLLLPDPNTAPDAWLTFILDWPSAWSEYVGRLFFVESCTDAKCKTTIVTNHFECMTCNEFFFSEKALASHSRAKHNTRCVARNYVGADFRCVVCSATFGSRTRAIAHLTDKRRTKWADRLCEFEQLPSELVTKLDEADREERRLARVQGHSQPIAKGSSVDAIGRKRFSLL